MLPIRKPFDAALHAANDAAARAAVLGFLDKSGPVGWCSNPDQYGVDLIKYKGESSREIVAGIEVEIKRVWSGAELHWPILQLPERKAKFTKLEYPVEFWILNADQTRALIFPGSTLSGLEPVVVKNKYMQDGERFYQIPIDRCRYVSLTRREK